MRSNWADRTSPEERAQIEKARQSRKDAMDALVLAMMAQLEQTDRLIFRNRILRAIPEEQRKGIDSWAVLAALNRLKRKELVKQVGGVYSLTIAGRAETQPPIQEEKSA